jgi:surface polysaccharide O-acyltransferase-like enzyme
MTTEAVGLQVSAVAGLAPQTRKNPVFEAWRGLAILMVVNGHTHTAGFSFLDSAAGQWNYWYTMVFRQSELCAVPLFLFVSGYLSGEVRFRSLSDYTSFLGRRLPRIMIPYLFWSAIFITLYLWMDEALTPGNFALRLAIGGGDGPYYFTVALLQCYMLAPLFSYLIETRLGTAVVVTIHVAFLSLVYYLRLRVFTADNYFGMPVFIFFSWPCLTWFTFFYLGMLCRRYSQWTHRIPLSLLIVAAAVMFAVMYAEAYVLCRTGHREMATAIYRVTCGVYSFFIVIMLFKLRHLHWPRFLVRIGGFTFGIFFIHMFLLRAIEPRMRHIGSLYAIQPAYQLFATVIVLCASIAVVIAGRRVLGRERASKWLGF